MNQEPQNEHALLGRSQFDRGALRQQSYSTDAQAVETKVARNPATQYLVINSKDRNQTSSTGNYNRQPWNQFRLQRPQALMQTYATRMLVSEINFPWCITNVNVLNNKFWILAPSDAVGNPVTLFEVELFPGYYTANGANITSITEALNTLLSNLPGAADFGTVTPLLGGTGQIDLPPLVGINDDNSITWTAEPSLPSAFNLFFYNPNGLTVSTIPPEVSYYTNPSLLLLMGMEYQQVNGNTVVVDGETLTGNPTTLQYTQYIDIVSDKLHQYTTNRDGNSDNFFSRNLLCRLYISDESSNIVQAVQSSVTSPGGGAPITTTSTPVQFIPGVNGPFIIHRQFKNPKAVMWNKEASVDWLDIAIYDEFGNLVPLGSTVVKSAANKVPANPTFPDFQITLLASEN